MTREPHHRRILRLGPARRIAAGLAFMAAGLPAAAAADVSSFVVAALAVEREALAGVLARRGAVDTEAVEGRVVPRSGIASLDHLSRQDRNSLAALRRGENRAAEARAPLAAGQLSWANFADAEPKGDAEWRCMVEALYFEARGESLVGQVAVAEVILNRADDPDYPSSICGVVAQGTAAGRLHACQFSYNCDGKPEEIRDRAVFERLGRVAQRMIDGMPRSLTGGATHYHADHVEPRWSRRFERTARIGDHIFYRVPDALARH
jgi:spore germination cell wall hydrolase CwlJ-like protein